jgi:hypothetical protein
MSNWKKFEITNVKYIIVNIGYTSRIIDKDNFQQFEKVNKVKYPDIVLLTQAKDCYGYQGGKDYLPFPESKIIRTELSNILRGGEAVFKVDKSKSVNSQIGNHCCTMKEFEHCGGLDSTEDISYFENDNGEKVAYVEIDTESG